MKSLLSSFSVVLKRTSDRQLGVHALQTCIVIRIKFDGQVERNLVRSRASCPHPSKLVVSVLEELPFLSFILPT